MELCVDQRSPVRQVIVDLFQVKGLGVIGLLPDFIICLGIIISNVTIESSLSLGHSAQVVQATCQVTQMMPLPAGSLR